MVSTMSKALLWQLAAFLAPVSLTDSWTIDERSHAKANHSYCRSFEVGRSVRLLGNQASCRQGTIPNKQGLDRR